MTPEKPKLCVECMHYMATQNDFFWPRCARSISGVSVVTGPGLSVMSYCWDEREKPWRCGEEGKYWEPKP